MEVCWFSLAYETFCLDGEDGGAVSWNRNSWILKLISLTEKSI